MPTLTTTERMKNVRRANTAPELGVRAVLRELGIRFRTGVKSLPGSPDMANKSRGWAIFVHGCFGMVITVARFSRGRRRTESSGLAKVQSNRASDRRKPHQLRLLGYRVLTVWQCELKEVSRLKRRLAAFFKLSLTFA